MIDRLPSDLIEFIGLGVFVIIGVFVIQSVKIVADRIWRNSNGNRRKNDDNWPAVLIEILIRNGEDIKVMANDISEIKYTMKNGLRTDLTEVKNIIQKCHELNVIKDFELKKRSEKK